MKLGTCMLAALSLSTTACRELAMEREVKVLLPAPPVTWQIAFPGLGFRVVTRDARGGVRETDAVDWRGPLNVPCARDVNTPVLAYPLETGKPGSPVSSPGALRPAGGFYPSSLRSVEGADTLELTWEDGAAALVISRVAGLGRDVSLFNVTRLRRFFREEKDPWGLDLDRIAQKISQGDFTAWDIRRLPSRDAEAEPGPGTWFLESPFSASFPAVHGAITLSGVSLGAHGLFSLDGAAWKMEIGVGEVLLAR
jgi:hypothetical protein